MPSNSVLSLNSVTLVPDISKVLYLNIKTNEVNEANFDKLNQREPDPYSPLNVNLLCSLCAELSMVTLSCELSIVLVRFRVGPGRALSY
jgi:hypothetical protein